MTKITNPNKGGIADPKLLELFETKIDAVLPDDYKRFLLTTNGGLPSPDSFLVNDGEEEWESNVYFYGLQTGPYEITSLLRVYEEHLNMIPGHLIPIGTDVSGNLISFSKNKTTYGQIFFTDHDYFSYDEEEPTNHGTYYLTHSFTEFYESHFESRL